MTTCFDDLKWVIAHLEGRHKDAEQLEDKIRNQYMTEKSLKPIVTKMS
jgi:hypothetical protein